MRKTWSQPHLDDLLAMPQQKTTDPLIKHQQFRVLQGVLLRFLQVEEQKGDRCQEVVETVLLILKDPHLLLNPLI